MMISKQPENNENLDFFSALDASISHPAKKALQAAQESSKDADTSKRGLLLTIYSEFPDALEPYETHGAPTKQTAVDVFNLPPGSDSYSPAWAHECEIRGLTQLSKLDVNSFIRGVKQRRGDAAANALQEALDRRLYFMKVLNVTHPRINEKKAYEYLAANEQLVSHLKNPSLDALKQKQAKKPKRPSF